MSRVLFDNLCNWVSAHFSILWLTFEKGIETLLATLAGGLITFGFVLLKTHRDRRNTEIAAGTRALFTLVEMWNATKQYQKEIVDPYRGRRDAWLNLHVGAPLNPSFAFDIADLTFLMRKAPKVMMDVLMEENRYRLTTYLVEDHRRLAIQIVWPKLEAAGLRLGSEGRPEDEIHEIIGPAALKQMQVVTGAIITNFDENVKSLQAAFVALRTELIRQFPKAKFVNFNFDPPPSAIKGTQPYYYPHGPRA
jgi:hypothetical protein